MLCAGVKESLQTLQALHMTQTTMSKKTSLEHMQL